VTTCVSRRRWRRFPSNSRTARYTGDFSLKDTEALARGARGDDRFGLRNEFVQLVELAQSLRTSTASNACPLSDGLNSESSERLHQSAVCFADS
jgi:hypothetical protein